ncbi:hypothetical protein V7122_19375 [Bacillus sp. JJ1532]|uniref:hypothetical protein n=1 Tax=Bacillus sp. JJ1532 TaxID=3122958 RepID=UPI002FFEDA76
MTNVNVENKVVTYKEALKVIQEKLNSDLSVEERMNLVNELLEYDVKVVFDYEDFDFKIEEDTKCKIVGAEEALLIIKYVNDKLFSQHKKKTDPLYEDTYLAKGLSNITDYLLEKWNEWEDSDPTLEDYTIQSKYDLDRLVSAGKNKQIIGFDSSTHDEFGESGLSSSVLEGWEFHVDQLEKMTRADDVYRLSENNKKKMRDQLVSSNLIEYPVLYERYLVYKEIGLRYGFDKDLSKDDKQKIKERWIGCFTDNPTNIKPKDRYYRLQKMYNGIGYEIFKMLEQNFIKPKANNQIKGLYSGVENSNDFILDRVALSITEHVNGLLTIQRGGRVGEYHPIFIILKERHDGDKDSAFNVIIDELLYTLDIADLSDMERDIVLMIIGEFGEMNIHKQENKNPYDLMATYINEKYNQSFTKTELKKMVNNKIARVIACTYDDLEKGLDVKECVSCRVEKMASINNFGKDTRNKSGLKSVCKKCAAELEKKRRENEMKMVDLAL